MIKEYLERLYRFLVTIDSEPEQKVEQTIPIEEHNRVKQALLEANNKIISLTRANQDIINKNDITLAEIERLQAEHRHDLVTCLAEGCYFKDDEHRKGSIESFTNANLTIDEIKGLLEPFRDLYNNKKNTINKVETKLPQKSIPDKTKDFSYYI